MMTVDLLYGDRRGWTAHDQPVQPSSPLATTSGSRSWHAIGISDKTRANALTTTSASTPQHKAKASSRPHQHPLSGSRRPRALVRDARSWLRNLRTARTAPGESSPQVRTPTSRVLHPRSVRAARARPARGRAGGVEVDPLQYSAVGADAPTGDESAWRERLRRLTRRKPTNRRCGCVTPTSYRMSQEGAIDEAVADHPGSVMRRGELGVVAQLLADLAGVNAEYCVSLPYSGPHTSWRIVRWVNTRPG